MVAQEQLSESLECVGSAFESMRLEVKFQVLKNQVGNIMTDPIADLLIRLKNASMSKKSSCDVLASKFNKNLLQILVEKGFIKEYKDSEDERYLIVKLVSGKIFELRRLSKPGRRLYVGYKKIPLSKSPDGIVIVSTPNGLMTGKDSIAKKSGGELICEVA